MKLRIFGSSVRFRMRPPEVAAWLESGTVSDGVRIGPRDGDRWSYRLEVTPAADWDVAVESGHWVVSVPQSAARAWADAVPGYLEAGPYTYLTPPTDLTVSMYVGSAAASRIDEVGADNVV